MKYMLLYSILSFYCIFSIVCCDIFIFFLKNRAFCFVPFNVKSSAAEVVAFACKIGIIDALFDMSFYARPMLFCVLCFRNVAIEYAAEDCLFWKIRRDKFRKPTMRDANQCVCPGRLAC